jgi:hypothetical protein
MPLYLQTSTNNPYGHRPWQTRLDTGFDNFSYLKQPQNTILREDLTMRPEIYKPPELNPNGLGSVTVVTGSGRVVSRGRRRRQLLGALPAMVDGGFGFPSVRPIARPIFLGPPMPGPAQTFTPPFAPTPLPYPVPVSPVIYPPTIVPPVPTPVAGGPGGTVWALPGTPATPGSPYMPATPAELPAPGIAPGATAAVSGGSFMDWFNSSTWFAGIPNGYVAIGAAGALWLVMRKRGGR